MAGLLDGMRVLDLSQWRPMPQATQLLADLGAEVLKVEPPGGDPMRSYPEIFASVARGKRSVVLDLRSDAGSRRAQELAARADVVCEGWRPGVAARFGLDYAAVSASNPAIIYCSLSGFGQDGPLRSAPGHDLNFQAIGGALAPRYDGDRDPEVPRLPIADLEGGSVCALLICAAWARRARTGTGERIDVAMADVVAWWAGTRSGTAQVASDAPTFGSPGYGLFRSRDDQWIALGVLSEQRLWDAICRALELGDLEGLAFDARLARTDEVNATLARVISDLDRADALARFDAEGAPASPVLRPEEVAGHPQFRERGFHVATDAGLVAALPARLDHGGRVVTGDLPRIDEHPGGFSD
jgi:crotonobetainyl-CoA:carnitine CoA-transferase CaiB-like acyl-CoA transferase